jgi:hypothetical protein
MVVVYPTSESMGDVYDEAEEGIGNLAVVWVRVVVPYEPEIVHGTRACARYE